MHHMYLESHEPAVVERNREILRYLTIPDGLRVGFKYMIQILKTLIMRYMARVQRKLPIHVLLVTQTFSY